MGKSKSKPNTPQKGPKPEKQTEPILPQPAVEGKEKLSLEEPAQTDFFAKFLANEKIGGVRPLTAFFLLVLIIVFCAGYISYRRSNPSSTEQAGNMVSETADSVMGDAARLGDMDFTVLDYEFSDLFPDESTPNLHEGNTMCIVKVSAKNISKTAVTLTPSSVWSQEKSRFIFSLIYADGYKYDIYREADADGLLLNYKDEIIPLQTISGYVCFEVPKEITLKQFPLGISIALGKENNTWLLFDPKQHN